MTDTLTALSQQLDAGTAQRARYDAAYEGRSPMSYLAPAAKVALGSGFNALGSNVCRVAVTALAERLRVTGFTVDGAAAPELWAAWLANDLDQLAGTAHREALVHGASYVIVWADAEGAPLVTIESAHQVTVQRDPATRRVVSALKRWGTPTGTEAILYGPEQVIKYRSDTVGAASAGQFRVVESLDNPLGVVPVVELANTDRLLGGGASELADLLPLQDALDKLLADLLVASEYYARPRRWATGVELEEVEELDEDGEPTGELVAENPFPEGDRMLLAEDPAAKFGSLPAADLKAYESALAVITSQIQTVAGLPAHYLGVNSVQPPSADGLRAAEASLTARAEARQATFGRAWEKVARLMHGILTGRFDAEVRVSWADAATRSIAQEADAVTKLYQAGLLPASYALARLGYGADEVDAIRAARRAEALDNTGTDLGELLA
ncbi:hypothetical protein GCM10010977_02510 [Citricoccus zhacaiensis]|uniref:Phage portal protein n=1 Tax=Citricoccus zhacaiensis TaxID=489142 RepID=A0ABQ2LMW0_9MICC|nr:phage portal protein [Citricoccus zhacaiensis]GGO40350.1 hypothetical protein GCM10010977_02510 [Citricoccus zhacaiensis]